jgi:chromosome segregation ATPase
VANSSNTSPGHDSHSLPQRLLIGYDRKATDELIARLDASYQDLSRKLEHLHTKSAELDRRRIAAEAERDALELRTETELDAMRSRLARLERQEQESLTRLQALEQEASGLRARNTHLEGELEASRLDLAEAQERESELEARVEEADRELADAGAREEKLEGEVATLASDVASLRDLERDSRGQVRTLEVELTRYRDRQAGLEERFAQVEGSHEELLKREAELEERCRLAEHDLAAHQRRELIVAEILDSAKRRADKIKADARSEASKTLKKARERRIELLESASRDVKRVETEKDRLERAADELRAELSTVLTSTLEQLKTRLGDDSVTPLRAAPEDSPKKRTPLRARRTSRARRPAG